MMKSKMQTITVDVLKDKEAQLGKLTKKSTDAVNLVTKTIDDLQNVNNEIAATISDIDTYQTQLNKTKDGLTVTQQKNNRIVANFKSLLEIE